MDEFEEVNPGADTAGNIAFTFTMPTAEPYILTSETIVPHEPASHGPTGIRS